MHQFYNIIFLFIVLTIFDCHTIRTDLKLVFVIFRHGERVPEVNEQFPNDPYKIEDFYPLTYGEITKEGKQRLYRLGQKLRLRYDEFLGPLYLSNQSITFTTNWDRTKMSAQLLLAGLYPPHSSQIWSNLSWLPIPYHYRTSEHDHIIQRPDVYCPRYVEELSRIMRSDVVMNITDNYKELFDYVSNKSGRNIFDYHEMLRIYQNFYAKDNLNLSIPIWAKDIYPEPMRKAASYQCVFENFNTLLKRLNGGHILKNIINIFEKKIQDKLSPKQRKIYLISGHENNIVNILAVLGLYKQHIPPYGSAVIIELHKLLTYYAVKIIYENSTYTNSSYHLTIPECSEYCQFDQFVQLTKLFIPTNYTAECNSSIFLDDQLE